MRLNQMLVSLALFILPILSAILGVDYGQQFTKAALVAPGIPFELVLTSESKRKDLSGISIKNIPGTESEIERVYGSATGSLCTRFPHTCLLNLKPLLGKSVDDPAVQDYLSMHFGVSLVESNNNRKTISFDLGSLGTYSIEEVVAMNLNDIKSRASKDLSVSTKNKNSIVDNIAISVSPFASQPQRYALLDAIDVAGMNAIGLVDDGVAIATNYASSRSFGNKKEYHIIYDMGAGSTKATLFSVCTNLTANAIEIEIEGVGYDESLGGQHLTRSVFQILKENFLANYPQYTHAKLDGSPRALARLWESAEKTKTVLSANTDARVSVESLFDEIDFKTTVTRAEFEEINSNLMKRVTQPILDALKPLNQDIQTPFDIEDLESIILAGGSTRVPFVQSHLTSLVGTSLISKNINADESVVLGSTLRGVLIAQAYKTKNIKIMERSIFDYDITYGVNEQKINLFSRGAIINNSTTIKLDDLSNTNKDFSVDLYENGHLLVHHQYKNIAKSTEKLNCENGVDYYGTFTLDGNRIFRLSKLEAKCTAVDGSGSGFFGKFLKSSSSDESTESEKNADPSVTIDSSESTATKSVSKPKKTNLSSQTKYPHSRPMGASTKESAFQRLRELNKKDNQRKKRDEVKNLLEGALYGLRYYLEEDEVIENYPVDKVEKASALVTEYLEWLEFESDEAKTSVFEEKIKEIEDIKTSVKKYMHINEADLSGVGFAEIYNEGVKTTQLLKETISNITQEIGALEEKYQENGLSFDKESAKIKINFVVNTESEIQDTTNSLKDDLTEVQNILKASDEKADQGTLETIEKTELFDLKEKITSKTDSLKNMLSNLVDVHKRRSKLLKSKLERHILKVESKAAKAESTIEDSDSEATTIEESPVSSTTITSTSSSTDSPDHDEL